MLVFGRHRRLFRRFFYAVSHRRLCYGPFSRGFLFFSIYYLFIYFGKGGGRGGGAHQPRGGIVWLGLSQKGPLYLQAAAVRKKARTLAALLKFIVSDPGSGETESNSSRRVGTVQQASRCLSGLKNKDCLYMNVKTQ